ncbi:hypothetical protein HVX06_22225 (plasmid) [Enterobacter sp. RHB15-C17]|jgi:uncharacterized membrane protein YiaA|nr:hypothetical protein HVX06_22225 [Enterobacter sp. RHB15-C17]
MLGITSSVSVLAIAWSDGVKILEDPNETSVILGSFLGAMVYILGVEGTSKLHKIGYFSASFFLGLIGAVPATDFITKLIERLLEHTVCVNKSIGAVVAAAVSVKLLSRCIDKVSTPSERKSGK